MISVSEKSAAYSGLHTDSSIDKSKRPQDHSVDSPSDKFPVFCALAISRRAVSTPPYCANIWLNRVGLYLHSFFACIIFLRSSSSNVLVNTYSQSSAPNRLTAANTKTIHKAAGASCPQPSIALRPSNRLPDCAHRLSSKFLPTHSHPRPFLRQEVLAPQWVGGSTQHRKSARGIRHK